MERLWNDSDAWESVGEMTSKEDIGDVGIESGEVDMEGMTDLAWEVAKGKREGTSTRVVEHKKSAS